MDKLSFIFKHSFYSLIFYYFTILILDGVTKGFFSRSFPLFKLSYLVLFALLIVFLFIKINQKKLNTFNLELDQKKYTYIKLFFCFLIFFVICITFYSNGIFFITILSVLEIFSIFLLAKTYE